MARAVADSPKFSIVAGEAVELVCIAPSQAVVGEAVEVFVKGQDMWGNPTEVTGPVELDWEGEGEIVVEGCRVSFCAPGSGRLIAAADGLRCYSNPVAVSATAPQWNRYWGDLHAQSDATVGVGTEEEYFAFARDWARVDFASHQGNDFQVDDQDWQRLNGDGAGFSPGRRVRRLSWLRVVGQFSGRWRPQRLLLCRGDAHYAQQSLADPACARG